MNPARVAALRLGMGEAMTAFTVQINCGSGMQSIDTAYRYIREGVSDLVLAGGAESLSHAPLVFSRSAVNWYAKLFAARGIGAKLCGVPRLASVVLHAGDRARTRAHRSDHRAQYGPDRGAGRPSVSYFAAAGRRIRRREPAALGGGAEERLFRRRDRTGLRPRRHFVRSRRRRAARQFGGCAGQAETRVRAAMGQGHARQLVANHRRRVVGHSWLRKTR